MNGAIDKSPEGLTLRDYFAAAALTGLCAKAQLERNQEYGAWLKELAKHANAIADAMLKQRSL